MAGNGPFDELVDDLAKKAVGDVLKVREKDSEGKPKYPRALKRKRLTREGAQRLMNELDRPATAKPWKRRKDKTKT